MNPEARLRRAAARLREGRLPVVESTAAATVAWIVDTRLIGHPQPFFAPAAALIVLGQARGQRMRRAVEVLLGVAGGVLLADLVADAPGPHTTWTIFTVILLTLAIAVAIGASTILVVQASVSAVYVAVVTPPAHTVVPYRFIDALVGGGVALIVSQLAVVRDPLAPLIEESRKMFEEIADILEDIAAAVDRGDVAAAQEALHRARRADASVERLRTAVSAAGEALRLDVRRRSRLGGVRTVDSATRQIDYVVRSLRVLARAGVTLTRLPGPPPPELGSGVRSLAVAVRAVDEALAAELAGSAEAAKQATGRAEAAALDAVATAGRLLPDVPPLPLIMIVGQLRTTVIDLLRGIGADDIEVLGRVDEALGLPPV